MSSITLNIKRIRNKYDINLNMIIESSILSNSYIGYKINNQVDINDSEVIIEVIQLKENLVLPKIFNEYTIEVLDMIYDRNNLYIIYPNYKKYNTLNNNYINNYINNKEEFYIFCNQFRELIIFIKNNKLEIESIKMSDIYIKNNKIYVMLKYKQQSRIIKYGSPIYSPPELFNNNCIMICEELLWNFGIILFILLKGISPYNMCKDIRDINKTNILNFNSIYDEDKLLKLFLTPNITERIKYNDFINLDFLKYDVVLKRKVKLEQVNLEQVNLEQVNLEQIVEESFFSLEM